MVLAKPAFSLPLPFPCDPAINTVKASFGGAAAGFEELATGGFDELTAAERLRVLDGRGSRLFVVVPKLGIGFNVSDVVVSKVVLWS